MNDNFIFTHQIYTLSQNKHLNKEFWERVFVLFRRLSIYKLVDSETYTDKKVFKHAIIYALAEYNCSLNNIKVEPNLANILTNEEYQFLFNLDDDVLNYYTLAYSLMLKSWFYKPQGWINYLIEHHLIKNKLFVIADYLNDMIEHINSTTLIKAENREYRNCIEMSRHVVIYAQDYVIKSSETYKEYQEELAYEN